MKDTPSISQHAAELGAALSRYVRIMLALFRREEEERRAAPGEAIMNLLEPIFMIVTISLAWWLLDRNRNSPLGGSPLLFFSSGLYAKFFLIYISRRMGRSVESSARRFPVEQRLDHIFVHIVLRIIDYSILGVLLFGVIYFFFTVQAFPSNFVPLLQGLFAIAALGFGWGMLNIAMRQIWWMWDYFFPGFNRILILFSGIFILPDFMTPGARYFMSFNPMVHAIILFRQGFYPQYKSLILDTTYLTYGVIFAIVGGLVIERATRRYER